MTPDLAGETPCESLDRRTRRLKPPFCGLDSRAAEDESIRITPEPWAVMRRAAAVAVAVAVRNCVHMACVTGRVKSSGASISILLANVL